jgi:glutaredoxin
MKTSSPFRLVRSALGGAVLSALLLVVACKGGETPPAPQQPGQPAATPAPGTPAPEGVQPAEPTPGAPAPTEAAQPAPAAPTGERVAVVFHVMSQCPFGTQVEDAIKPVLDQIGDAVDFKLEFIGDEPSPGQLESMHGPSEVQGNLVHICAAKHAPKKYMDVIVCMNRDMRGIPGNFEACATETGVDAAPIKACAEGEEGKALLSASFAASKAKGAAGSPTIFLAGKPYQGGRKANDFLRAICNEFQGAKPGPCANIPEPPKVPLTVLSDVRCKECFPDGIIGQLKGGPFPGLQPKVVDYGTPEGKELWAKISADGAKLPAFLFDPSVAQAEGFQDIARFLEDVGGFKSLRIGGRFDPTAEICDNNVDDNGDGAVDCADATCAQGITCRPAEPNRLDVFVMSQCPYGVRAIDAMKEVLPAFGNDIDFRVHYIVDEGPGGEFRALHGPPEVAENIRQLCVMKHYPKDYKWMEYLHCRSGNYQSDDWKPCATGGIDAAVIEACATGDEGKALLSDDLKLAKALDVNASPTWLANNRFKFNGIAPEQVKQAFCQHNQGKAGCEKTLSGPEHGAPTGGGCGG